MTCKDSSLLIYYNCQKRDKIKKKKKKALLEKCEIYIIIFVSSKWIIETKTNVEPHYSEKQCWV